MIKLWPGKLECHKTPAQRLAHAFMGADLRAETEAAEKHVAVWEQVPFAFKKYPFRRILDGVSLLTEILNKRGFLALTLGIAEMAGDECPAIGNPGVRGENHVRASLFLRDKPDV